MAQLKALPQVFKIQHTHSMFEEDKGAQYTIKLVQGRYYVYSYPLKAVTPIGKYSKAYMLDKINAGHYEIIH